MAKIAAVQLISSSSVKDNLHQVEHYFLKAKEEAVDLLVLPENFAFMGKRETDKLQCAERFGEGEIQDKIRSLAKRYGVWVIAGTLPVQGAHNKVRASSLVYDNQGQCVARYDKIHLFDVRVSAQEAHQESLTVERGTERVVVDTPVGRVGLSVCYDLRFPELYHQLASLGAELFAIPSAFTALTGLAHWEVLLRARAIENLTYVVAANQGGLHENGRQTYGCSMVVEPWGKIIAQLETGEGMVASEIDLQRLHALRQQFPCNAHHVLINEVEKIK
ncbi:MAG: carbon-nitrogen hydrolase family protein [Tatlockia sp.]|jgi:nitrilase